MFNLLNKVTFVLGVNPLEFVSFKFRVTFLGMALVLIRLVLCQTLFFYLFSLGTSSQFSTLTSHSVFFVQLLQNLLRSSWIILIFGSTLHLLLNSRELCKAANFSNSSFSEEFQKTISLVKLRHHVLFFVIWLLFFPIALFLHNSALESFLYIDFSLGVNFFGFATVNLMWMAQSLQQKAQFAIVYAKFQAIHSIVQKRHSIASKNDISEIFNLFSSCCNQTKSLIKAHGFQIYLNFIHIRVLIVVNLYFSIVILENLPPKMAFFMATYNLISTFVATVLLTGFALNLNGIETVVSNWC